MKNNKLKTKKAEEKDISLCDRYISRVNEEELNKLQKRKTIYLLISVALYAVALLMPSSTDFYENKRTLNYFFVAANLTGIIFAIYILYQNFHKHKIRKVMLKADAPIAGFNKRTYTSFEIFCFFLIGLLIVQIVILIFSLDIFSIIGAVAMTLSMLAGFVAKQILYVANAGKTDFVKGEKNGETNEPTNTSGGTDESSAEEKKEESQDFYS